MRHRGLGDERDFFVRFWGVRGSIACPGPEHRRYGGNTSCLEVRCGEHILIFDAGTGLRYLGNSLADDGALSLDLFLTHTHHDHIVGTDCSQSLQLLIRTRLIRRLESAVACQWVNTFKRTLKIASK